MSIEIKVKDSEVFYNLINNVYHYKLIKLTMYIIEILISMSIQPVITSGFRASDSGVHGYGRGIDFRTWSMQPEEIEIICNKVNYKFHYDPKRPWLKCLFFHDTGKGPHLHAQVHDNTKEIIV